MADTIKTPLMVVTDAGLAAAQVAMPEGPYIHIVKMKIGAGYGYDADRTDTGMRGPTLYEALPTTYRYVGGNVLNIICKLPPDAGPFDFGEVSLWLDGDVMFAKAVFDVPQTKFSSLNSNVGSSYTFNCLLDLEQSVAVFKIDAMCTPDVWEVDNWSDVYPPAQMANPDIPLILCREGGFTGLTSLLQKGARTDNAGNTVPDSWCVGTGYDPYTGGNAVAGGATYLDVPASAFHAQDISVYGNVNKRLLLRVVPNGDGTKIEWRSVKNVTQINSTTYRLTINGLPWRTTPSAGNYFDVFRDTTDQGIYYSQIIDPPVIQAGPGLYKDSLGRISARGLLHGPEATGTGRFLNSTDSIDNYDLPTGIYMMTQSAGFPSGVRPANDDALIKIINDNDSGFRIVHQMWIPTENGPSGTSTTPMYYRGYKFEQGIWSPWFPILAKGKNVGGTGYQYISVPQVDGWSEVNSTGQVAVYIVSGGQNPNQGGNNNNPYHLACYVNGSAVASSQNANQSWTKSGAITFMANPGDTVQVLSQPYPAGGGGQFNVSKFLL